MVIKPVDMWIKSFFIFIHKLMLYSIYLSTAYPDFIHNERFEFQ